MTTTDDTYALQPIGFIRSTIQNRRDAACQGNEGAPDVWLDVLPDFAPALLGITSGAELIVVAWFHHAARDVMQVHPRRNPANPLTGVFFTRSPDRPNPLGLHRVTVHEIKGHELRIGPMEAIDGTPVVDIKVVLDSTER